MSLSKQEHSQMIVARGVALMLVGLVMWLWVRGHSPHMGYAEMLADMDNWILKEPFYSVVVVISALFALSGGIQLYRGLRLEPNLDSGTDNTPQFSAPNAEPGAQLIPLSATSADARLAGLRL